MNQSKYVKKLSKHQMRLIAKMRGINVKKSTTKKKRQKEKKKKN